MTGPRNRRAIARSQRERAVIRATWIELVQRSPFEPVTARRLAERLPFKLSPSALYWHMDHIRIDAALAELSGGG
jgi:hypothetical protein